MPERILIRRKSGWRLPPNSISVARPHRFGNPFAWREGVEIGGEMWAKGAAVELFRNWLRYPEAYPNKPNPPTIEEIVDKLRGKNLGCFCKPGEPCHADVLLALANPDVSSGNPPPTS